MAKRQVPGLWRVRLGSACVRWFPVSTLIAFHRGYSSRTGRRAGQVRLLHILRPVMVGKPPNQTEQAFCHAAAWPCTDSPRVEVLSFPLVPPEGLAWCPTCIGWAAERLGLIETFARAIAEANR